MPFLSRAAAVVAFAALPLSLAAQPNAPLRAEKTIKYRTGTEITLGMAVGPVKVSTVKFTVGDNGDIGSALKAKMARIDPATQTMVQIEFDAENPATDEWSVTYSLEFLDGKGAVVDRVSKKFSYEGQATTSKFDHVTMKAVLPLVANVRIKLQAELE